MSTEKWYLQKELSWLSFNERVLQEAIDKAFPWSNGALSGDLFP
ncbi:hypothetical protein [Oceanisphaera psychrotolerans]|nr:hypothetical protein [Oceanisphaera psychrotolerans]